jgi:hypothetical protein
MEKEFETKLEELYIACLQCARINHQTISEKNDYYITMEQLNDFLIALKSEKSN